MKKQTLPKGWSEDRVKKVIAHYEGQSENEALEEDEAAYKADGQSMIEVPDALVSKIRRLIVSHAVK